MYYVVAITEAEIKPFKESEVKAMFKPLHALHH